MAESIVLSVLENLNVGESQKYQNLTMYPLMAEKQCDSDYLTLDEALKKECVQISEISEEGAVPELKFSNNSNQKVLVLDGEELIGAKQNRVLNITILVPQMKAIKIPVSCVEAHRWHYSDSMDFKESRQMHYARGRSRKFKHVSESMRERGTRHSDQMAVWDDISDISADLNVSSETGAMSEIYQKKKENLGEYIKAFSVVEGQVGAIFAINDQIIGLDLFENSATLDKLMKKIIGSYALDAISLVDEKAKNEYGNGVEEFLSSIGEAKIEKFPAIGEGEDFRLSGEKAIGGALVANGKVIHLCAFRQEKDGDNDMGSMSRSSIRRRHRSRR